MHAALINTRIAKIHPLTPPHMIMGMQPASHAAALTVTEGRASAQRILHGSDDRLLVVVGPCSIHDPDAALDYASRLVRERDRLADLLHIVMRVYFEKPRTIAGWKGLINDPGLDGTFDIERGLRTARGLLAEINDCGMPAACEFLDTTTPQYLADLVSWGAIGARTTESQVHREMSSGLSCPIGFKNGTDGNVTIAIDAVRAAARPHHFLAVTSDGRAAMAATTGNEDTHVILRGGRTPNYGADHVEAACRELVRAGLAPRLVIDASHGNSHKNHENQPKVVSDIAAQVAGGDGRIVGVMIESNLLAGRQDLTVGQPLRYGQSITDGCIGWDETVPVLEHLAEAVSQRRRYRTAA